MTYEHLYELGWKYEYNDKPIGKIHKQNESFYIKEDKCRWIMGLYFTGKDDYSVMINWVDETVTFNEWENSDTHFYGNIKTKEDLQTVMRFLGIIEY